MKLSIIICTYNASGCLSLAFDSVLAQTYTDYEVVVVDGASSDGTQDLIKSYAEKFSGRLRWVSEPDSGIYDAMNKGIELSHGEWLYFLGSDDIFSNDDVLEVVSGELADDVDVIYGNVIWGESGKIHDGEFSPLKIIGKNICHQSIFFKKQVFEKLGKFETKYSICADWVFNWRWFNDGNIRKKYVDIIIARYDTGGLSSQKSDVKFLEDSEGLIKKYFSEEYYENHRKMMKLEQELSSKNQEIALMKASKFWKLRKLYLKMKGVVDFE